MIRVLTIFKCRWIKLQAEC